MLVDRLEAVINGGWRSPVGNRVCIDEREALDVLDLMRTAIPEEIKQARRTNQERDKVLAQAQTESNRLISQAQERAERLLGEDNITRAAEERARVILDDARRDADEVRHGADDYALQVLERLDDQLRRVSGNVRNAINALHATAAAQEEEES